jgi:hypothetical protein
MKNVGNLETWGWLKGSRIVWGCFQVSRKILGIWVSLNLKNLNLFKAGFKVLGHVLVFCFHIFLETSSLKLKIKDYLWRL